jgi:general secretion pathway protein K
VRAQQGERGAALVVTLIFATAMAAGAVAFLNGRRTDALTLRGQLQAVEAQAMLDAALQQTFVLLANKTPRQVVPDRLSWRFGDVAVRVRLEQEAGKVDLNRGQDRILRALALAVGLDEERAGALADAIQDWRDDNQVKLKLGAEDQDYRGEAAGITGAADRPFADPAELRYVAGMDRAAWALLQPFVTVYSGAADPDVREAAGPVRDAVEIARGLEQEEPEESDTGSTASDSGRGDEGSEASDASRSGVVERPSASTADFGTQLRRESGGDGRDQAAAATSGAGPDEIGAAAGNGDDGSRTVLLEVRFPNGYQAAAKAVIASSRSREDGPPFMVLSWTPVTGGDRK